MVEPVERQLEFEALRITRNEMTRTSYSLETSVTFPLHVLHVLLREANFYLTHPFRT